MKNNNSKQSKPDAEASERSSTWSIYITDTLGEQIADIAARERRSWNWIAADALRAYVATDTRGHRIPR